MVEARLEIERLEQLLLVGRLDVHEARDEVRQRRGRLDRLDRVRELGRRLRQQRHRFGGEALQIECACFDLAGGGDVGQEFDARDHERQAALPVQHAEATLAWTTR
jgi:hypothetical protein